MPGSHGTAAALEPIQIAFTEPPIFVLNPSGYAPLAGQVRFATNIPSRAEIVISDGDRTWALPQSDAFASHHELTVLGMRPGRAHWLSVSALDEDGNRIDGEEVIEFATDPLPEDFPPLDLRVADRARMAPGVTMFGLRKSAQSGAKNYGVMVAVDDEGEVVWYRDFGQTVGDVKRLRNGNLIYLTFDHRAVEFDMLGNVINQWIAVDRWPDLHKEDKFFPVAAESFHHEIFEMANGNFLVLSVETRDLADYPSSDTDPDAPKGTATVVGDVVVEFTRDGQVVDEWKLLDSLDPYRFGYGVFDGYWERKGIVDSVDWTHANAVVHDERDDSLILSLRHQDAVVKIDRKTKSLKWILGTPEGWNAPWSDKLLKPVGDVTWQFHQHNSLVTPEGTILLFDNGNCRTWPFEAPLPASENYSRVAEFEVDEEAMTVRQVWSYGGPGEEASYCPFICGAQPLPESGTVLACFGGMLATPEGAVSEDPTTGIGSVRLVEVTRDPNGDAAPEKVFELFIDTRDESRGWDVYRAVRLPSLYA